MSNTAPASTPADPATVHDARQVMNLLDVHVPLSLLVDLILSTPSAEILAREGGDARWMTDVA